MTQTPGPRLKFKTGISYPEDTAAAADTKRVVGMSDNVCTTAGPESGAKPPKQHSWKAAPKARGRQPYSTGPAHS